MTTTSNATSQAATTPQQALDQLLAGNRRFLDAQGIERDLRTQVSDTAGGQWPIACILGCIDSRVPAELVFDTGIGDVFNARVAGNFVNEDILGSMEFACRVAGAKLVMVLGHTHCGAVKGACDGVELGNLTAMLAKIQPAVDATTSPTEASERTSGNAAFVREVTINNVGLTLANIRERSSVLAEMEQAGEIALVGALYDVETGAVEMLDAAS